MPNSQAQLEKALREACIVAVMVARNRAKGTDIFSLLRNPTSVEIV